MRETLLPLLIDLRPEADFSASTDFIADGLLDSFDIVALVGALDEKFRVAIRGVDILPENFRSLAAIEALVRRSPAPPS
jgi:acyl carrier protein